MIVSKHLLFAYLMGLLSPVLYAQERDTLQPVPSPKVIKLGLENSAAYSSFFTGAYEHAFRRNVSVQGQVGFFPFNTGKRYSSGSSVFFGIMAEGRFYINLVRKDRWLHGFFVGPTVGFNYANWHFSQSYQVKVRAYSSMAGINTGGQLTLSQHLAVCTGLRFGYSGAEYLREVYRNGLPPRRSVRSMPWSLHEYIAIGYRF